MPSPGIEAVLKTFELTDATMKEQICDQGVEHKIACKKGCSVCCKDVDMPILDAEIETIGWYIKNRIGREIRRKIMRKVDKQKESSKACPFVIEDKCFVYPVRPLACRTHLVMNKPCAPGENIFETRFDDRVDFEPVKLQAAIRPLIAIIEGDIRNLEVDDPEYQKAMHFILSQKTLLSELDWKGFLNYYLKVGG